MFRMYLLKYLGVVMMSELTLKWSSQKSMCGERETGIGVDGVGKVKSQCGKVTGEFGRYTWVPTVLTLQLFLRSEFFPNKRFGIK